MKISKAVAIAFSVGLLAACAESTEEERAENIMETAEERAENVMENAEQQAENIMETAENRAENVTDVNSDTLATDMNETTN